jgi:hypothetical protein
MDQLQAVRSRQWKLYLPLEDKRISPFRRIGKTPPRLYDLKADLSETDDLVENHPDVVQRLTEYAEQAREDLGDVGRPGKGQRPAGKVADPMPQVLSGGSESIQKEQQECEQLQ